MNELQKRGEEVLLELINKGNDIGSAAMDQIPLVVQELLYWKFAESIIFNILGLVMLFGLYRLCKFLYNYFKDLDIGEHPEMMFSILTPLLLVPIIQSINLGWLQIWIAPRIYLLEYAASIVK